MLQFLQPILLWAAAGITVPVVIHLWNIRQGKTLKVGSIVLITESAKSQRSSFKITQWLLLLLRCLLIIALAMLMAKPYFNKQLSEKEKGWIVIEKSSLKSAYHTFQPTIDSLLKKGFTLHYFDANFAEGNLKDTAETKQDTSANATLSYWTLLKAMNEKVPADFPVYLFTNNLLKHFSDNRPEVSMNLKWYIYPSDGEASIWLSKAYQTTTDSIRIIIRKSNSTGTYYINHDLSLDNINSTYKITRANGNISISSTKALQGTVSLDTATLFITIYTNKYFTDANYLRAALQAIEDFTQQKIRVNVVSQATNIPVNRDWLFWLSDEPIPASLIQKNVLVYANGKVEKVHSYFYSEDKTALTTEPVTIYQYIKPDSIYQPVWKNGLDESVLSMHKNGVRIYHFYSRFNPQWSDLVWSHSFPQIMYNLLFNEEDTINNINDKRSIYPAQIQPVFAASQRSIDKEATQSKEDLSRVFWCIAFCIFLLERIISFRQIKGVYE